MNVAVIGLGKIGLPVALQAASRGHQVIGSDIRASVVASITDGREPFPGEPGLATRLATARTNGTLTATTDTSRAVRNADVVVVVVPLIIDDGRQPDFTAVDMATAAIGASLKPGALVVYETTLPVGITRNRLTPALEKASGLERGRNLFVGYSPERVSSGRVFADLGHYPKLVGGIDHRSTRRAAMFYREILDFDPRPDLGAGNGVWELGSSEAAELAKLVETTYRDVNIALANEFAVYADRVGVDIHHVIEAANSQPFSHVHQPGVAVGGHCIPVYPRFYLYGDPSATLPAAARAINEAMPGHVVTLLDGRLGGLAGKRVAVLGATYRGGVKELAFSGVFPLVERLTELAADVVVHDPMLTDSELGALGMRPFHLGQPVDGAIVQADHARYRALAPADLPGVAVVIDGRAVVAASGWDPATLVRLGGAGTPESSSPTLAARDHG